MKAALALSLYISGPVGSAMSDDAGPLNRLVERGLPYPVLFGALTVAAMTAALVFLAGRFDATQGALTVSLVIVVTFAGAVFISMASTVPQDEATAAIIGGLVSAVGATVAFWLTRKGP